jgi:hypothetical protein
LPSTKKRIGLSVPDELYAALGELSEVAGKPITTICTELLVELIPQIQGLAKVGRAAKSGNKAAAKRALQHMMGDAMAEMMTAQQPELFAPKKARK